ncbi:MAG: prolyl oligopeptidase family serine peptidase [Planctomycetes bacterium]|nr:prolyl oligopeptidase family serine peptidase [Planctomycetota bacterium]
MNLLACGALVCAAFGPFQEPSAPAAPAPVAPAAATPEPPLDAELHAAVDRWLDRRFGAEAPREVLALLAKKKLGCADLERVLRAGRASYPEPPQKRGELTHGVPLPCDHVDHETQYLIHVPTSYAPSKPTPVLFCMHGGSAARDLEFGLFAALSGIQPYWINEAEKRGWILVAPLSDRGWMHIGNSLLFSALSRVQRDYHVDPDRIYLTGHSMGGHMTWRSAFQFPDRFGAVSPMSGGYDYVKSQFVVNLLNVPGYTTYGKQEPYQINEFNNIIAAWMKERAFPWIHAEKDGGHEIFEDEVPKVAEFFAAHPRDLYPRRVYARFGAHPWEFTTPDANEAWGKTHTWREGRPIAASTVHWVRGFPPTKETPPEQHVQLVDARVAEANTIEITSLHARKLRLYLHPRLVDFAQKVKIRANGKVVHDAKVKPSAEALLGLVKEFDDRGRIYWAYVDVSIAKDGQVEEPRGEER